MTMQDILNEVEVQGEYRIALYDSKRNERIFLADDQENRERKIAFIYVELGSLIFEIEEDEEA